MRLDLSRETVGLVAGPSAFAVLLAVNPAGLDTGAAAVLAATTWIVVWWVTEAIPIPVTSLLPVVLFPLTGVTTPTGATLPYADPIVFLLLGGFLLALSIERWNLHHRLSLMILSSVGTSGKALVFGFMIATAVLSMWISNTATAYFSSISALLPEAEDVGANPDTPGAGVEVGLEFGDELFSQPEMGFVFLLFWLVVPLSIGYYRFNRADL